MEFPKEYPTFDFAAGVFVVNENNQILVIDSDKNRGYSLPFGKKDEKETLQECAIRETLEETGYIVEILEPLVETIKQYGQREVCFAARIIGGQLTKSNEGPPLWVAMRDINPRTAPVRWAYIWMAYTAWQKKYSS